MKIKYKIGEDCGRPGTSGPHPRVYHPGFPIRQKTIAPDLRTPLQTSWSGGRPDLAASSNKNIKTMSCLQRKAANWSLTVKPVLPCTYHQRTTSTRTYIPVVSTYREVRSENTFLSAPLVVLNGKQKPPSFIYHRTDRPVRPAAVVAEKSKSKCWPCL